MLCPLEEMTTLSMETNQTNTQLKNILGDFYGWFTKFTAKQHLNLLFQKYFQAKLHETNK
jgi:hypothetical protein